MLKDVIEVIADSRFLKIYFFQLFLEKSTSTGIEFVESKVQSLIQSKLFDEMEVAELFECCVVARRCGDEDFQSYLPGVFYYVASLNDSPQEAIFNHPKLYKRINSIIDGKLYEAEFGFDCHLLNGKGEKIYFDYESLYINVSGEGKSYSINPNVYDNGYYDFKVYSDDLIEIFRYDDNNGGWFELFQYKNESRLVKMDFIDDRQLLFSLLQKNEDAEIIRFASDRLLKDFELMSLCISLDSSLLKYASEELQNNFDLVFQAVSKDGMSLEFASDELRNDKRIVLSAIQEYPHALAYASGHLKNDKEIALFAIDKDSDTFKYLGQTIKNDPEIKSKLQNITAPRITDNGHLFELSEDELNEAFDDADLPF
jgi:hypothetical protein